MAYSLKILTICAVALLAGCERGSAPSARAASEPDPFDKFAEKSGFTLEGVDRFERQPGAAVGPVLAKRGDALIKVRVLESQTKDDAERYTAEQSEVLKHLFDPALPPYPEFLTNQTACPAEFHPVAGNNEVGSYFVLFANERFGYGVCAKELMRHRAGVGFFYCAARQRLVKVEYFLPPTEPVDKVVALFNSFKCL